jgi:hypothetical protein
VNKICSHMQASGTDICSSYFQNTNRKFLNRANILCKLNFGSKAAEINIYFSGLRMCQSKWDLRRKKWHWDRVFSEFLYFPLSI